MFSTPRNNVVISETDLDAALAYLRDQPCRETLPVNWDRQRLLNQLNEAISRNPRLGEYHAVAPGVFAIVKPAGTDLVNSYEPDGHLQVWLLIRPCGTDPTRMVSL